jgi:DNA polymerase-1
MANIVLDIETNAIDMPDKLWCVVTQDVDTGEVKSYHNDTLPNLRDDIKVTDTLIGHHILGYDLPQLRRLLPHFNHPDEKVIDTLILSRLYHFNIRNGHSLKAWGARLRYHKIEYDEFDKFTPEMLEYCTQDVALNVKLFKFLDKKLGENFKRAIEVEHRTASVCKALHKNGFDFNMEEALKLHTTIHKEKELLDEQIQAAFPPVTKSLGVTTPRATKGGGLHGGDFRWMREDQPDLTPFAAGCPFSRFTWVPFNPQSPAQIIDRVHKIGWEPFDMSQGHQNLKRLILENQRKYRRGPTPEQQKKLKRYEKYGWKVNVENFSTINPYGPKETSLLIRRLLIGNRLSVLNSWFEAYNTFNTGKIHGVFLVPGCWTHRMAHRNPNMGNIPNAEAEFGAEMRSLWNSGPDPSQSLVGCDASSIQLRILAHYLDNEEFTDTICAGTEEKGTDIHTRNAELLDIPRSTAKTWIYAWLLGAGTEKLSHMLKRSKPDTLVIADTFMDRYTGFRALKTGRIVADAERGYFEGIDGRYVVCPSEHHMLAGYLQNGEALVMRYATLNWMADLEKQKVPFWICNLVHDEWQVKCATKDAEKVGKAMVQSLVKTGQDLKLNCPLSGNYKIGKTWLDTH